MKQILTAILIGYAIGTTANLGVAAYVIHQQHVMLAEDVTYEKVQHEEIVQTEDEALRANARAEACLMASRNIINSIIKLADHE